MNKDGNSPGEFKARRAQMERNARERRERAAQARAEADARRSAEQFIGSGERAEAERRRADAEENLAILAKLEREQQADQALQASMRAGDALNAFAHGLGTVTEAEAGQVALNASTERPSVGLTTSG